MATYNHSEVFKVLSDGINDLVEEERQNGRSLLWRLSGRRAQLHAASGALARAAEKLGDIAMDKAIAALSSSQGRVE